MVNYALMLRKGLGGEEGLEKARYWYEEAAKKDQINAMNSYALMLEKGQGGDQDLAKA